MEQDREAKALEQVAEWVEAKGAKGDKAEAAAVEGKAKVASDPGRAETASAPAAVKKRPTRWERPATTSSVPSVGHP